MKLFRIILGICCLSGLLMIHSCKDDWPPCDDPTNPDCDNYDPCYGKKTINSFFKVRPGDRGFPPPEDWCELTPCDTFNASSVRFDAPDGNPENSTYQWQIGTEAEPRTGKGFEVDFSNYLSKGNWESHITVTLTIRSPINSCLKNPSDTLVVTSRELFFTEQTLNLYLNQDTSARFKGYFTNDKDKEVVLEFTYFKKGNYQGFKGPFALMIGAPFMDTIMAPYNCHREGCRNYRHIRQYVYTVENCDNKVESHYLKSRDFIYYDEGNTLILVFEFSPPEGRETRKFIGERL